MCTQQCWKYNWFYTQLTCLSCLKGNQFRFFSGSSFSEVRTSSFSQFFLKPLLFYLTKNVIINRIFSLFTLLEKNSNLKDNFDILGNTLIGFLAESYMRRILQFSCLWGKYEILSYGMLPAYLAKHKDCKLQTWLWPKLTKSTSRAH